MPGYDRTGPQGMGPMTGGARGFCNPAATGYSGGYGLGRGMAYGGGRRGGFGMGRGMRQGFRAGGVFPAYPPAFAYSDEAELNALKAQATAIKNTLDQINQRIAALDKTIE